jgi:hypothetical protein
VNHGLDPETVYLFTFREPVRVVMNAKSYRVRAANGWLTPNVSSDQLVGLTFDNVEVESALGKLHAVSSIAMGDTTQIVAMVHIDNIAAAAKQGQA